MKQFVLACHGMPRIGSPEEGECYMKKWTTWTEGLGENAVIPGMPVGNSITVSEEGLSENGRANPISGITILCANMLAEVIDIAKSCPYVLAGGSVEIAPQFELS